MMDFSQSRNLLQMRDAAAVHDGHADVIDELFGNEYPRIPNGAENLTYRHWRLRVLAYDAITFLEFSGHGVFQPEQMIRLETLSQACCFDGCEAVVRIM